MPYINPKGKIHASAPPRRNFDDTPSATTSNSDAAKTPQEPETAKVHYLHEQEEEDMRPMDPKVVDKLDHWHGFQEERQSPQEEPDVDPMDETGVKASEEQ